MCYLLTSCAQCTSSSDTTLPTAECVSICVCACVPKSVQFSDSVACNHHQPRRVFLLRLFRHKLAHAGKHVCPTRNANTTATCVADETPVRCGNFQQTITKSASYVTFSAHSHAQFRYIRISRAIRTKKMLAYIYEKCDVIYGTVLVSVSTLLQIKSTCSRQSQFTWGAHGGREGWGSILPNLS